MTGVLEKALRTSFDALRELEPRAKRRVNIVEEG
jgi:hypothetical protein